MDRRIPSILVAALLLAIPSVAQAVTIVPNSSTMSWLAISYATEPDAADDQASGNDETDIVGNALHPSFYTAFDNFGTADPTDGFIGFRLRLGADKNGGYGRNAVVGIDVDLDGDLDIFLAVDNQGSDELAIFAPGPGTNDSPVSTSWVSTGTTYALTAANYDVSSVDATIDPTATDFDLDNDGNTDAFLSWVIPFADVVAAVGGGFDDNAQVYFVAGTSNGDTFDRDISGPVGSLGSALGWVALGAASDTMTVPEPRTFASLGLGLAGLAFLGRRRR